MRLAPPLASSILDVIGHTPLVELKRILRTRGLKGRLLAKLEHMSPGFSKKDRIALAIIRAARAKGLLKDGQSVVELTSGNTGTGLAIVCRALGHPFVAVMSRGNSIERARMMQALGAEVILVDQSPRSKPGYISGADLALVEEATLRLVQERKAFRADQFANPANVQAHEHTTGPEIWEQSKGKVDVFLDFSGTGGTFTGISRFLRSKNPELRAYLVEPAGSPALAGGKSLHPNHKIQGGGYNFSELPLLERNLVTSFLTITDEAALEGARILADEEGIFAGYSSGAHLAVALELLKAKETGATIVFLVCDSGLKYLSTDLFL